MAGSVLAEAQWCNPSDKDRRVDTLQHLSHFIMTTWNKVSHHQLCKLCAWSKIVQASSPSSNVEHQSQTLPCQSSCSSTASSSTETERRSAGSPPQTAENPAVCWYVFVSQVWMLYNELLLSRCGFVSCRPTASRRPCRITRQQRTLETYNRRQSSYWLLCRQPPTSPSYFKSTVTQSKDAAVEGNSPVWRKPLLTAAVARWFAPPSL